MLVQELAAYLYAEKGLVASTQPERSHRLFNNLMDLFDQVILQRNLWKTVITTCQYCHTHGSMLEVAYEIRTSGVGPTYREWKRRRVQIPECGVELAAGSLLTHHQIQNGVGRGSRGGYPPLPPLGRPISLRHPYQIFWHDLGSWCRGVGKDQRTGPTSGLILCNTMCGKLL